MKQALEQEVVEALQSGRKIEAIKILRTVRGIGLKEAKGIIESHYDGSVGTRPSVEKVQSGSGWLVLAALVIAGYFAYKYFVQ